MTGGGRPPTFLRLLASLLLPRRGREFVLGDMEELFVRRAARRGRGAAVRRYLRDLMVSGVAGRMPSGLRRAGPGGRHGPSRRGGGWAGGLPADVRMAFRTLWRERGFTLLTVATLALGIGAAAAVFGMVNQLLLRPLAGVTRSAEAGYLQFRSAQDPSRTQGLGLTTLDFDELRRSATLLEGMASFGNVSLMVSVGDARPVRANGNTVYGDYFEVLGAWPAAGRLLRASETGLGADPLRGVLGERLAATLFGSAEAAVGRSVRINGHPVSVVGVAGGGFAGAERGVESQVWLPWPALIPLVGFTEERLLDRRSTMHGEIVVGLPAGADTAAARAQVVTILEGLAAAGNEGGPYLAELEPWLFPGLHTPPLIREITRKSLRTLAGVVLLVLLVACANAANLLLFRNLRRRGMLATRRALGASSARLAREHVVESLALALGGAGAGLAVGWLVALPFRGAHLTRMPPFEGLVLDGRVWLFAGAAAVATALLFGVLPAVMAGRFDLARAMRSAGGRDTGRLARLLGALSAGQFALSLALVVGAFLLLRTIQELGAVDFGISTDSVLALTVEVDRTLAPEVAEAQRREVLAAAAAVQGVVATAQDPHGPFGPRWMGRVGTEGAPAEELLGVTMVAVTPGWFELMKARHTNGRTFRPGDGAAGGPVPVVVTESLARRLFGTAEAVGRGLRAGFGRQPPSAEVIGVVGDLRSPFDPSEVEDVFFVPFAHAPAGLPYFTLLARVEGDAGAVAPRIRRAVEAVLPAVPVPDPEPLSARLDLIHAERHLYARLLTLLAGMAVLLSAVGLYGVVGTTVAARRREFGVRLALGAARRRIAGLVARSALSIVVGGTVVGMAGAWALSRVLSSRLFGVGPLDPATWLGAALAFALVSLAACWVPARRAMAVDPMTVLREE